MAVVRLKVQGHGQLSVDTDRIDWELSLEMRCWVSQVLMPLYNELYGDMVGYRKGDGLLEGRRRGAAGTFPPLWSDSKKARKGRSEGGLQYESFMKNLPSSGH